MESHEAATNHYLRVILISASFVFIVTSQAFLRINPSQTGTKVASETTHFLENSSIAINNSELSHLRTMQDETVSQISNSMELPQILTMGSVGSLVRLDAGDLVECYAITRMALLRSVRSPSSINSGTGSTTTNTNPNQNSGNSTSTSSNIPPISSSTVSTTDKIQIVKSGLAFRFTPKANSNPHVTTKLPFELTLEYGPQRTGSLMDSESMPIIHSDYDETRDSFSKFLSWENEGKVYYEPHINPDRWITANFMAPITGAVLSKILQLAVDYSSLHPRYQPFEVIHPTTKKPLLKSSSSDDFVWNMFGELAKMYVDLNPILPPPQRKLRLYALQVEKVTVVEAGNDIADFFENLYECGNAIKNGNYDYFQELNNQKNDSEDPVRDMRELNVNSTENETLSSIPTAPPHLLNINNSISTLPSLSPSLNPSSTPSSTPTLSSLPTTAPTYDPIQVQNALTQSSALLSGHGSLMTQTLLQCFLPPVQPSDTHIYLFIDGSNYFQLKNLSEPYLETYSMVSAMPKTSILPPGKSDLIDWTLAILIISSLVFGIAVILERIGWIDRPHCFHRYKSTRVNVFEDDDWARNHGAGMPHAFAEDAIPYTMGGNPRMITSGVVRDSSINGHSIHSHSPSSSQNTLNQKAVDVEREENKQVIFNVENSQNGSNDSEKEIELCSVTPRHPDLVAMPDLKYSSKVAIPVSLSSNTSIENLNGVDFDNEDDCDRFV